MKTYNNLWEELCSIDNLNHAFEKAKKRKSYKLYVIEFEKNLKQNLNQLRLELLFHSYRPKPLVTFVIKEPKTRIISKSHFMDRIAHHAICNVIEPIFDKYFIYDSYANRKGKGTLKAVQRFEYFKRKVSKNNTKKCFILKADIQHYFDNIDRDILFNMIQAKIKDTKVLWLVRIILNNNISQKGMPLGNLTSQFFANIYLNELDQYVKQNLKVKYYIRYVDDFVILSNSKEELYRLKENINSFLSNLGLQLHPGKSRIIIINKGISFLGYRIFPYHKLLKKSNLNRYKLKLNNYMQLFQDNNIEFETIYNSYIGWQGYAKQANTYNLRKTISNNLEKYFFNEVIHHDFPCLVS
jgi:retron-type reverse transcriptase